MLETTSTTQTTLTSADPEPAGPTAEQANSSNEESNVTLPKPIPPHLRKYVVQQDYDRYTPEDQAVWRYIMRQLKSFFSEHAHECYSEGLARTGINIDEIPRIEIMDQKLRQFGWGAVAVSGFIPPAAFMEFQSLGYLPIASDMRTLDHILYTPAPDIVHEAAGHAPILVNEKFAEYLKRYAEVASRAIISNEDMALYKAIRDLSDVKEDPSSSEETIKHYEQLLTEVTKNLSFTSEAGLLGRMNWWTAEYGLIGSLDQPKIFGAGLLSSKGESASCLQREVKKIPLTIDCINYSYDITEPQPQLFVTPDFENLILVLDELAQQMAFKIGGIDGLNRAIQAKTVNTVELDSGLQISGILSEFLVNENQPGQPIYLKFSGPSQLAKNGCELAHHGPDYHRQGYGTPLGKVQGAHKPLYDMNGDELLQLGIRKDHEASLQFSSGVRVSGKVHSFTFEDGRLFLITFTNCTVSYRDQILFVPEWGTFDMAVGENIPSVFGGPADRERYGETEDFVAARVPLRNYSPEQQKVHQFFAQIRTVRQTGSYFPATLRPLLERYYLEPSQHWLIGLELLELLYISGSDAKSIDQLQTHLRGLASTPQLKVCIEDGIQLASQAL